MFCRALPCCYFFSFSVSFNCLVSVPSSLFIFRCILCDLFMFRLSYIGFLEFVLFRLCMFLYINADSIPFALFVHLTVVVFCFCRYGDHRPD